MSERTYPVCGVADGSSDPDAESVPSGVYTAWLTAEAALRAGRIGIGVESVCRSGPVWVVTLTRTVGAVVIVGGDGAEASCAIAKAAAQFAHAEVRPSGLG